jgi:hypothetical protein
MRQFRRVCLILLAAFLVSAAVLPLGSTNWAEQFRARSNAPRPPPPDRGPRSPVPVDNRPRRRPQLSRSTQAFIGSFLQMGIPAGVTLVVLSVTGRRRRQRP